MAPRGRFLVLGLARGGGDGRAGRTTWRHIGRGAEGRRVRHVGKRVSLPRYFDGVNMRRVLRKLASKLYPVKSEDGFRENMFPKTGVNHCLR